MQSIMENTVVTFSFRLRSISSLIILLLLANFLLVSALLFGQKFYVLDLELFLTSLAIFENTFRFLGYC